MDPESKPYRCVHCGATASALYRSYGPAVIKLTHCEACGEIVDKYVEYDPVIIMIDLILVSKEAQRHVLYNTKFKVYWKMFIVLALLETYGLWCQDNIINIGVHSMCEYRNATDLHSVDDRYEAHAWWWRGCASWGRVKVDDNDPFISEKAFYVAFIAVLAGTAAFVLTTHCLMTAIGVFFAQKRVRFLSVLKAFTLGNVSKLFTLPMLIWGISDSQPDHNAAHYLLVLAYSFLVFVNTFTVIYACKPALMTLVLALSCVTNFWAVFLTKSAIDTYL